MRRRVGLVLLVAATLALPDRGQAQRPPGEIQVVVRVRWDWVPLPGSPGSAIRIARALDAAGKPYDASLKPLGCRPADLRRSLRLPKTDYLLGEPIVVEMAVALEGPGAWQEPYGGNYRARGRDDNFLFVLRAADGTWVPDPYEKFPVMVGGGLGSTHAVRRGAPLAQWLAVQRWAAIDRSGTYDLYAMHFAHGYDVVGIRAALKAAIPAPLARDWHLESDGYHLRDRQNRRGPYQMVPTLPGLPTPGPVAAAMPAELRAKLGKTAEQVQDFARFRITVRQGSPAEIATMVRDVTGLAAHPSHSCPTRRADAAREAIWFARQDMFLPTLRDWTKSDDSAYYLAGLAMNPAREAAALLLGLDSEHALGALHYLDTEHIRAAIPVLITRLDDQREGVRSLAEDRLCRWTGQSFGHAWDGYRLGRPTRKEGRAMRHAWQGWWDAHAAGFTPRRQ